MLQQSSFDEQAPECPPRYQLKGNPVPLANPDDPYWIAEVVLVTGPDESYDGILIYASSRDYYFFTKQEAQSILSFLADHL
jgi:hypothetical protein